MKTGPSFREIEKEGYYVQLPPLVIEAIRERARREGRPQALIATEALCRSFDLDPQAFGIRPLAAAPA